MDNKNQRNVTIENTCPICNTESLPGEISNCSTCNWDLTPCSIDYLDRENIHIIWGKQIWTEIQSLKKPLHRDINNEINANPQLSFLIKESEPETLNLLINWVCSVDIYAAKTSAIKLKERYKGHTDSEIAHIIIVEKTFQAACLSVVKGIGATQLISALANVDIPTIAILSAEMIYQIAAIYGHDLNSPERQLEVIAAFGLTFLGEQAIDVGIDWLKCGLMPGAIISAATKGLMMYALGNTAILLYEAKVNETLEPLSDSEVFNEIRQESQRYVAYAQDEEVVNIISSEIKQAPIKYPETQLVKKKHKNKYSKLRSLLASGNWRAADEETNQKIFSLLGMTNANSLTIGMVSKIPRKELKEIDYLWKKYSKGRFGFSVQKEIYDSSESHYFTTYIDEPGLLGKMLGKTAKPIGHYTSKEDKFFQTIGWSKFGFYNSLNFSRHAPSGHLPSFINNAQSIEVYQNFFNHIGTRNSHATTYN
ncbi:hypothetical protein NIES4071_94550 [Calothrix sp. NIES-4071]|nr:hypothetical protein NIES4071_94550 [Calothrix sp. NIES-4071]BAZ63720.1 hypothetical protein NIES4105_94480 [Calothrix sp. NIES-4105]